MELADGRAGEPALNDKLHPPRGGQAAHKDEARRPANIAQLPELLRKSEPSRRKRHVARSAASWEHPTT